MNTLKKRGISPVIATVLLIAIVVVLSSIIFLWAKGFIKEAVIKNGRNVADVCNDISLDISCVSGQLEVTNTGNIPISNLYIKKKTGSKIETTYADKKLTSSQIVSIDVGECVDIEVYPAVLGMSGESKKIYTCENSFGV
ncbi:MAG: hypothetical protein KJ559_03415 [Nanoarchaeota archaeon]|nr:hypothetical protein [Nanoarchaeota archaeon]